AQEGAHPRVTASARRAVDCEKSNIGQSRQTPVESRRAAQAVHARPEPSVNGPSAAQASKPSRFITLVQDATKSLTNFSWASALPYTSASARSTECEPKTRSARVPVHFT